MIATSTPELQRIHQQTEERIKCKRSKSTCSKELFHDPAATSVNSPKTTKLMSATKKQSHRQKQHKIKDNTAKKTERIKGKRNAKLPQKQAARKQGQQQISSSSKQQYHEPVKPSKRPPLPRQPVWLHKNKLDNQASQEPNVAPASVSLSSVDQPTEDHGMHSQSSVELENLDVNQQPNGGDMPTETEPVSTVKDVSVIVNQSIEDHGTYNVCAELETSEVDPPDQVPDRPTVIAPGSSVDDVIGSVNQTAEDPGFELDIINQPRPDPASNKQETTGLTISAFYGQMRKQPVHSTPLAAEISGKKRRICLPLRYKE